jgi:hypothetical protein
MIGSNDRPAQSGPAAAGGRLLEKEVARSVGRSLVLSPSPPSLARSLARRLAPPLPSSLPSLAPSIPESKAAAGPEKKAQIYTATTVAADTATAAAAECGGGVLWSRGPVRVGGVTPLPSSRPASAGRRIGRAQSGFESRHPGQPADTRRSFG